MWVICTWCYEIFKTNYNSLVHHFANTVAFTFLMLLLGYVGKTDRTMDCVMCDRISSVKVIIV